MAMELRRNGVLMMSAPAVAAVLMSALLLGGIVPNTNDKLGEGLGATGYVTISVVRDGNEIYHYEDHNQLTEGGIDFIVQQVSGTPVSDEAARWIGLTTTNIDPDDDDTSLANEITIDGLQRAQGNLTYTAGANDNDDNYTITATFTSTGNHTGVQGAGLFTDDVTGTPGAGGDDGTMVAINEFSSVNLASGDQLTITWTIDLGITGLDA